MEKITIVIEGDFNELAYSENVSMDSILDSLGHEIEEVAKRYEAKSYIDDMES